MKQLFLLLSSLILIFSCSRTDKVILPLPSNVPSEAQLKQIERKYGMFIHFGINTFHNMEWTDGTKPASSYNPSTIDADQWIETAKNAGMKVIGVLSTHTKNELPPCDFYIENYHDISLEQTLLMLN